MIESVIERRWTAGILDRVREIEYKYPIIKKKVVINLGQC